MAYYTEWKDWGRFPEFFAARKFGLVQIVLATGLDWCRAVWRRDYAPQDAPLLVKPFFGKCAIVLGLYGLMLLQGWIREWTTGAKLAVTPADLLGLGGSLVTLKMLAETGLVAAVFHQLQNPGARRPQDQ